MTIELEPVVATEDFEEELAAEIEGWIEKVLYAPLLDLVEDDRPNEVPLWPEVDAALRRGSLTYSDGLFLGEFSAKISRTLRSLGAKWDSQKHGFRLPISDVPIQLRGAIATAKEASKKLHEDLDRTLRQIAENVGSAGSAAPDATAILTRLVKSVSEKFGSHLRSAERRITGVEAITVNQDLTAEMERKVRERLTESLSKPIKGWTLDETVKLRELVRRNWDMGGRRDRIEEILRNQSNVGKRRAAFIAQQETTMLAAEVTQARAEEIGSISYRWDTRRDSRVRDEHRVLDGKIFFWDYPPPAGPNGEPMNPGMAPGCRCVARPILNLKVSMVG